MLLQEAPSVVVVGGVGSGPSAKLYYLLGWHAEVGYLGSGAMKPVEVVLEIVLVARQLQEPTRACCFLGISKDVIVMLVRWLRVLIKLLSFSSKG